MIPNDITTRLNRLFGGQQRTEDLYHIFSWIRFHTAGKAPFVRDIGDFIAHRHERDQGFTSERTLDFCHMARLLMVRLSDEKAVTLEMLKDGCRALLRSVDGASIKAETKLSYHVAKKRLESGLNKIDFIVGLTIKLKEFLTDDEQKIIKYCISRVTGLKGISQNELMVQFLAVLHTKGYSAPQGYNAGAIGDFISKFVITIMHGSWILENKDRLARLFLCQTDDLAEIKIEFWIPSLSPGAIQSTAYKTNLRFPNVLAQRLLHAEGDIRDYSLEIDSAGLIDIVA